MEATIAVEHARIFILDPCNKNVIAPEYVMGRAIASNATCVSVATISEVDGEVTVHLHRQPTGTPPLRHQKVFEGFIETPGNRLAVVTSTFARILEIEVANVRTSVSVFINDPQSPTVVNINAE